MITHFLNAHYCCVMTPHSQIEKRLEPVEVDKEENEYKDSGESSHNSGCKIFLGYTSNLISSGVRETIRYLAEHNMVQMYTLLIIQVRATAWATVSVHHTLLFLWVRWM